MTELPDRNPYRDVALRLELGERALSHMVEPGHWREILGWFLDGTRAWGATND